MARNDARRAGIPTKKATRRPPFDSSGLRQSVRLAEFRNAFRNPTRNGIAVAPILHAGTLTGVAHESALHEDRRVTGVADNIIARKLHPSVGDFGSAEHSVVDIVGQRLAGTAVVKGFQPSDAALPRVVVVDAHEDRIAVTVANRRASGQRDETVTPAGHDRLVAAGLEVVLKSHRRIKGEMFLVDLAIVSPEIVTSVTRIDDDVVEVIGLCSEGSADETQQSKENSFQERTAKKHGTGRQADRQTGFNK